MSRQRSIGSLPSDHHFVAAMLDAVEGAPESKANLSLRRLAPPAQIISPPLEGGAGEGCCCPSPLWGGIKGGGIYQSGTSIDSDEWARVSFGSHATPPEYCINHFFDAARFKSPADSPARGHRTEDARARTEGLPPADDRQPAFSNAGGAGALGHHPRPGKCLYVAHSHRIRVTTTPFPRSGNRQSSQHCQRLRLGIRQSSRHCQCSRVGSRQSSQQAGAQDPEAAKSTHIAGVQELGTGNAVNFGSAQDLGTDKVVNIAAFET